MSVEIGDAVMGIVGDNIQVAFGNTDETHCKQVCAGLKVAGFNVEDAPKSFMADFTRVAGNDPVYAKPSVEAANERTYAQPSRGIDIGQKFG